MKQMLRAAAAALILGGLAACTSGTGTTTVSPAPSTLLEQQTAPTPTDEMGTTGGSPAGSLDASGYPYPAPAEQPTPASYPSPSGSQ